jgi:hypothetical protein
LPCRFSQGLASVRSVADIEGKRPVMPLRFNPATDAKAQAVLQQGKAVIFYADWSEIHAKC